MYLAKTIIELIVLIIAYVIATGMDQRITTLEDKAHEKRTEDFILGVDTAHSDIADATMYSFKSKINKEKKRMNKIVK